jgi:hypothetical protein
VDILGFLRDLWARVVALGNQTLLLIAQVRNVNTQVNILSGTVDNQGQTLIGLNTVVTTIQGQTGSPTYGNAALLTRIDSLEAALEAYIDSAVNVLSGVDVVTLTQIRDAIAALPAGSDLVNPTPGIAASDVWEYVFDFMSGWQARYVLGWAGALALSRGSDEAVRSRYSPFMLFTDQGSNWSKGMILGEPSGDWSDILAGDTRLSWLTRTEPTWTWHADTFTGAVYTEVDDDTSPKRRFTFSLTEREFQQFAVGAVSAGGPPIWPGVDLVALGEPVNITESAIVDGPMDGVVVTINATKPGSGKWEVDPFVSWFRGGYLIFLSAEGHADTTQYLGPSDMVYCCLTMKRAAQVVVRLNAAADVTVTPWTLL